ncbi:TIGR01244 family sulfur transferase [Devosia sp. YIM 151766]|uniref:TIGR01244 family sulfur transferase n=1 Tax=Devosia sp. YIM 151766 TaxID=3017325 RepID=UPI00255C5AC6|nr:TIGR01244 family sulfur transferase [Devosia sp. YIM 151766]WIY53706.1 TIGR01244 family sulfur transferase [Devosia sp. YIM 151766]
MSIKKIDDRFAASGQIRPEDIEQLARDGYAAIICARPDDEDAGQPAFAEIASEAEKHGLKAVHIPVSGTPSPEQVSQFKAAMAAIEGPVLGYCRAGGRAASLYSAMEQ